MIKALFGPDSVTSSLREGLDREMKTHREVASRVATALTASSRRGFERSLEDAVRAGELEEADLQRDMAMLADSQIRYEAEAKILKAAYNGLRSAIR
jgi:flagellar basal body rod protein FlgB